MIQISVSDIYDPNKMTVLSENERTVFCFYRKTRSRKVVQGNGNAAFANGFWFC